MHNYKLPFGSNLVLNGNDESIKSISHNAENKISVVFKIIFTSIFMSLFAYIGFVFIKISIIFFLFFLPFIYYSINMVTGIIHLLSFSNTIILHDDKIIISKKSFIRKENYVINISNISKIYLKEIEKTSNNLKLGFFSNNNFSPCIITKERKEILFFENSLDIDKEWIMDKLKIHCGLE